MKKLAVLGVIGALLVLSMVSTAYAHGGSDSYRNTGSSNWMSSSSMDSMHNSMVKSMPSSYRSSMDNMHGNYQRSGSMGSMMWGWR